MTEYPRITYNVKPDNTMEKIDKLFERIDTDGAPEELIQIRKEELQNHTQCHHIIQLYNNLFDLIGERADEYNMSLMEQWMNELIRVHAPIYYDLPWWPENADIRCYDWEEWTLIELFEQYSILCRDMNWYHDRISFREEFMKYEVIDMLNDLLVCKRIIGYEPRSFRWSDDSPLDKVPRDVKIPVKILRKGDVTK